MKYIIFFALIFSTLNLQAQDTNTVKKKPFELKVNTLYLLAGLPEISYEKMLSDNTSYGINTGASFNDTDFIVNYSFWLEPYFRFYFGKKETAGIFIESNVPFFIVNDESAVGLGFAVGKKYINKSGWTLELTGGISRLSSSINSMNIYPKLGISIGKRIF